MKFIHISDLHLGKRVNEFSMLEDQKYILKQILEICRERQADAVLLAGDLYDKQVPSAEAVQVLDDFLTRLADLGVQVFAVSGNHDSPERIAFGSKLMQKRGVYLSQVYDGSVQKITQTDAYGELDIYLLPFIKPASVRHALGRDDLDSYQDAVSAAVGQLQVDTARRNILVAHQFVTGASRCESEDILVGGLDNVEASVFDAFDYVALGHIHSPQHVSRETVRYCGTPLKYSFSEANQQKSVTLAEFREKGDIELTEILLHPLRDMRLLRGTYMELTARSFYEGTNTEDYVQITLTDEEDIPDGMQKLRIIYPNLMRLEYDNKRTRTNRTIEAQEQPEKKSGQELFADFYELQNNQEMSVEQQEFVKELFEELEERE